MRFIQYISNYMVVFIVGFVVIYGTIERKKVFEIFVNGVIDGEKIVVSLIPTWLGLFVAVGILKASGFIDFIVEKLYIIMKNLFIYKEILPLILLRPISGSTSTAFGIEIMKNVGVDSKIGLLTSCIMGSTETTIYVVSLYTSKLKGKNAKPVIIIGLIGDLLCIFFSIFAARINFF